MDEPYEEPDNDDEYDDWFNPFPMHIYAKSKQVLIGSKTIKIYKRK